MKQAHNSERVGGYRILVVQPEGKSPLGRPRHRRKDNIKMYFKEIGREGVGLLSYSSR
jgi:hypothetical protein